MKFKTGFYIETKEQGRVDFETELEAHHSSEISGAVKLLGGNAYLFDCTGQKPTEEDKEYNTKMEDIAEELEYSGSHDLADWFRTQFNVY